MSIDAKTVVYRWFEEVWNQGKEETVDELYASGGIGHGLGEGEIDVRSPEEFKAFLRTMRSALPDVRIRVDDVITEGDKAAVRLVLQGTHLGDGLGFAPTGRHISISGIVIVRVSGGQIQEAWNSWDQLGLLQQTGALPAPPPVDRFLGAASG